MMYGLIYVCVCVASQTLMNNGPPVIKGEKVERGQLQTLGHQQLWAKRKFCAN